MYSDSRLVDLHRVTDDRGSLTAIESQADIPFDIHRVFYLYDVPEDTERGQHAHEETEQLFVAVHGSIDVHLDDGDEEQTVTLDRPDEGLYVPSRIWTTLRSFSTGATLLVLASTPYDPDDYINDYAELTT